MIDPGVQGKTAIVTGSNSPIGIGAGIARTLARHGVNVGLVFTPKGPAAAGPLPETPGRERYLAANGADGAQVCAQLREWGVNAAVYDIDLADQEQLRAVVGRVEQDLGPVEILVNNQAHSSPDSFADGQPAVDAQTLAAHVAVNMVAPSVLMSAVAERIRARGGHWGRIINLSTDAAPAFPGMASYGATKLALESLSRTAATELGPDGITVNVVSPGIVQTGGITAHMEADASQQSPLGRIGDLDDIADIVLFLASEQSRWLTGQVLYAGGGRRMF